MVSCLKALLLPVCATGVVITEMTSSEDQNEVNDNQNQSDEVIQMPSMAAVIEDANASSQNEISTKDKKKLVFCCFGNTCRSPMAELYYRYLELQDGKIDELNSPDSRAMSRGIWDLEGLDIAENSTKAIIAWLLEESEKEGASRDVNLAKSVTRFFKDFVSKNIETHPVPKDSNFICVTSSVTKNRLNRLGYPVEADGIFKWRIPDPYQEPLDVYKHTWKVVRETCQKFYDHMENGVPLDAEISQPKKVGKVSNLVASWGNWSQECNDEINRPPLRALESIFANRGSVQEVDEASNPLRKQKEAEMKAKRVTQAKPVMKGRPAPTRKSNVTLPVIAELTAPPSFGEDDVDDGEVIDHKSPKNNSK